MYALYHGFISFLAGSIDVYVRMPPEQLAMVMWPFLFLAAPRYLLSKIIVLLQSFRREPRAKVRFGARLARERPLVSVLIPGHNEADTLETTVLALREQTYTNFEIIVVSDGSTDGMVQVARRLAARGEVRYFELETRSSKAAAQNLAFNAARGEYIVICDADTTFDNDAIWRLLVEFYRPDVQAVSGNVRARNVATNLLTRCQAMQYIYTIGIGRRVKAAMGTLFIVSGAFGAFRREAIERIGGWYTGPGEDADITMRVRLDGGQVAFAPRAMCMTDVPSKWYAFFRQQMRWNRSTVRWRLRVYYSLLSPWHRPFYWRNALGLLDILFFEIFTALIFPVYLIWLWSTYPDQYIALLPGLFAIYLVFNALQFSVALAFSERRSMDLKLLPYVPLYGLFMGWWLRIVRVLAYLDEWLFKSSYRDSFTPDHVQTQLRKANPW